MLNLNQLEHLLALDETRHFAKAANKVHLSQPAFSRSIQSIERQTKLTLFDRKGGSIRPTPAGQFLIERARQVLLEARSLHRDIGLFEQGAMGELNFGVGPFPSVTVACGAIQKIRTAFPKVAIRAEVANPPVLLSLLLKEEIEFFVADTSELTVTPYLNILPLTRQYGHLYARRDHPLAFGSHGFKDAWSYGVASVKISDTIKTSLGQLLGLNSGNFPQFALECDDVDLLHKVALGTDTIVASTELAAKPWLDNNELVMLDIIDFPTVFTSVSVVSLKSRLLSPTAGHAIEHFTQAT